MRPRLTCSFYKSRNPKKRDGMTSTTRQHSTLVSLRWVKKGIKTYSERAFMAMFNEYK